MTTQKISIENFSTTQQKFETNTCATQKLLQTSWGEDSGRMAYMLFTMARVPWGVGSRAKSYPLCSLCSPSHSSPGTFSFSSYIVSLILTQINDGNISMCSL